MLSSLGLGLLAAKAGLAASWYVVAGVILVSALLFVRFPRAETDPE